VGILTSQYLDTPEGLEWRVSVGIHRITAELPHSTKLELKKHHRSQMDSDRASMLELLREIPTSRKVLQPSAPLSLLYKEWTWEHYRKLNLTFFALSSRGSTGVFIGGVRRSFGR
jgi:hypothetical protein